MAKKRNLIIVESPNKIKTISGYLKDIKPDEFFVVMASCGHISNIADKSDSYWNTGIYPDNKFKINLIVSPDKKKVVDDLKEQIELADHVYIASDPDREGERIAWSLKKFLKLTDEKYSRVVFHEITKSALIKAFENPGKVDDNMNKAADARSIIDKMIGYRLSPIARKQLQAKSVGRCQSAALKLICDRENEINNFKPEEYFNLNLSFTKGKTNFKAKFIGDGQADVEKITNKAYADFVVAACKDKDYYISDIEIKQGYENPKPPFTTSTFQQEVAKKLGISLKVAMDYAQKLFEGINIGGQHIALTTYLRTDSTEMSDDFKPILASYVKNTFGEKYYAPVRKGKKTENAQEGHECFRVVDPEMTPEKLASHISDERLIKIYTIIWKRTIASSMASATTSNTEYKINNGEFRFLLKSKEYLFDGYRSVYNYKDDDEKEEIVKETFTKNEVLNNACLTCEQEFTKPPARYNEASIAKKLETVGIGRPSTTAKIVETILSDTRGYCTVEDKNIVPTQKGMALSSFLDANFPDIISITYTAELEKDLDLIATGKVKELDFLTGFYTKLEESATKISPAAKQKAAATDKVCPECGKPLVLRYSAKTGKNFLGCSGYPKCHHIENLDK